MTSMTSDAVAINLAWLLRLRSGAIAGQIGTIAFVQLFMAIPLPLGPLALLIALEALSNLALALWLRRGAAPAGLVPLLMALDVLLLSGLLYFTGGPLNPFSFLYLVQIALGAVILPARWTWGLVLLSAACSAVLFLRHRTLQVGPMNHEAMMAIHLRGMWVAFSVAAIFIVYSLLRVTRALQRREAELQAARARQERLAALATLAAGAAHELATPLSTIALVAREFERRLPEGAALEDARLIRAEVERCRAVLHQMAADAGESAGEALAEVTPAQLAEEALRGLPGAAAVAVAADPGPRLRLPLRALSQALRALLKNAQDASGSGAPVALRAAVAEGALRLEVRDRGGGMSAEVLARAVEPFFSTKAPGRGMGLGLFLVQAVAERLGGRLLLDSTEGQGTSATLLVPLTGAVCEVAR